MNWWSVVFKNLHAARSFPARSAAWTACVAALLAMTAPANAEIVVYEITLDPGQEVPTPTLNGVMPFGSATVTLDTTAMTVSVTGSYADMTSNVNNAHIHAPAPPGQPGSVIVPLAHTGGTSGTISVTNGTLSEAEVGFILNSKAYINIHTVNNGPGEIRGQIPEPASLAMVLGLGAMTLLARRPS